MMFLEKEADLILHGHADDFDDMFDIFMNDDLQEFQWVKDKGEWRKRIL